MTLDCTLFDTVRGAIANDLRTQLKAGNRVAVGALRAALHVLDDATAAAGSIRPALGEVARRAVSRADMENLLLAEAQERAAAAIECRRLGKDEHAGVLQAESEFIRGCLAHLHAERPR